MNDIKGLFDRITTVPKVRSINGVFIAIDSSLEHTNYEPYYQRNYVWDDEKATFFIETILLGSEIPPIILYKSSTEDGFINYEVIDGRQRYETILRFLNGELKLKKSGLQKLGEMSDFIGKTFHELSPKYQRLFKETKIRTIEYSFIGEYSKTEEEALKREIFQRYNSGITPLKSYELDKAKYFHNDFNQDIKELLTSDESLNSKITDVFLWEKLNTDQKASKIREILVLHRIPIQYYANKKQSIVNKYFEYISSQLSEDTTDILSSFINKIEILSDIKVRIIKAGINYNRLYAECLYWAFSVMDQNQIEYDLSDEKIVSNLIDYLSFHFNEFTTVRSSFYSVLLGRYKCIAKFFENEYNCSLRLAIENNEDFKKSNKILSSSKSPHENTIESKSFEELRINKPEPTSVELTELLDNMKSGCFTLRPPYQRGDVKNKKKSSSIIESMLLGVMLPPVFVFKRNDGTSEVIDGQQRLLSIISFIDESYKDEEGNDQKPLLHGFKLDLGESAVLKKLNTKSYKDLTKLEQNKIRKTSIFIIEIRQDQNPDFDPVDLFVRLNNKPYPIPKDSFEMWNSFAPRNIIQLIKDATKVHGKWFYFRKNNSRMDNETIYTSLAYFQYMHDMFGIGLGSCAPEKTIEVYTTDNRIACRFRNRANITCMLYEESDSHFIEAANKIDFDFVQNLRSVLANYETNSDLNKGLDMLISVENGKRTQMSFYILWLLLHDMPAVVLKDNHKDAFNEIQKILAIINTSSDEQVFYNAVADFRNKYGINPPLVTCAVSDVAQIFDGTKEKVTKCIRLYIKPSMDNRFIAKMSDCIEKDINNIFIEVNRAGICMRYVEAFLRSKLFWFHFYNRHEKVISALKNREVMPYVSEEIQKQFEKVIDYVDFSNSKQHYYFVRLLDIMFYELAFQKEFRDAGIQVIAAVKALPSLDGVEPENKSDKVMDIYNKITERSHIIGMYILKSIDIDSIKKIESI